MKKVNKIDIIANTMVEPGLSGGNRIFIELAKKWADKKIVINVFCSSEGKNICQKNGLIKANYFIWQIPDKFSKRLENLSRFDVFILYLIGLIKGSKIYLSFLRKNGNNRVVWPTSDYWPDSLVGFLGKVVSKNNLLIGSLFLFAPNPFFGFREKGSFVFPSIKNLVFYLTQSPVYKFMKKYADLIFVTSEPDKNHFLRDNGRDPKTVIVIKGGVDTKYANKYFQKKNLEEKFFDACFMGRFHAQKGVLDLVDIWEEVCKVKKSAKLIMIGHGELERAVKEKIKQKKLEKNIIVKGFLGDGSEKFNIFKKSKVVLHPASYDSGGMAAAEAMAWGLPGVSFDLEALKTYYPSGMLKARIGDNKDFSRLTLNLLNDKKLYEELSKEARTLILREWSWAKKADQLLNLFVSTGSR